MAASNIILYKAEDAIKTRLQTASLPSSATVRVLGDGAGALVQPWISVIAESAENMRVQMNYRVQMKVEIYTSADDFVRATVNALATAVIDTLTSTTIAADLSSDVADFRALGVWFTGQNQKVDGRHHIWTLDFRLDCCGADV